jgi:myosin heavy subunit
MITTDFVWVPVDGYTLCQIVTRNAKSVTVEFDGGEREFPTTDVIVHTGEVTDKVEDLIKIDSLNEAVILHALIQRYMEGNIYVCVFTGSFSTNA